MDKGVILVIEDDKDHGKKICDVLENKCETKGKKVRRKIHLVESCSDALAYLSTENKIELAILDLELKDRDRVSGGFEVLQKIKLVSPSTAVVVFTSHGTSKNVKNALLNNADDVIDKPQFEKLTEAYIENQLLPIVYKLLDTNIAISWNEKKANLIKLKEDVLIDRVLIPLLVKMGFQEVKRIGFHGFGELGKDIQPFYQLDYFGMRLYYAAQVKSGDINSTAGSSNSVNKLIDQIDKIITTSFYDPFENKKKYVDKAVGIISGNFKGESMRILQDKYENKTNAIFIDGDQLLHLLNKQRLTSALIPSATFKFDIIERIEKANYIFYFIRLFGKLSKDQTLEGISQILPECKSIGGKKNICEALIDRENMGSTGIGDGHAFPHTIVPSLEKSIITIAVSDSGIEWQSIDGESCNVISLILAKNRDINKKVLPCLSRFLKSIGYFNEICKRTVQEEMIQEIENLKDN